MTLFLKELKETANLLFNLDYELNKPTMNSKSKLIFPFQNQPQKGKKLRVSEQELRQCFIKSLNEQFYYSIETPTKEKYSFSGKGERSGSLDLCIYEKQNKKYERKNCIEFKAHNMAKSFFNDLHKLTKEKGDNYYIHLLQNCNNGTLKTNNKSKRKSLLTKLTADLSKLQNDELNCTSLTLVIICINPRFFIYQQLMSSNLKSKSINLDTEYHFDNQDMMFDKLNNWNIELPELSNGE